MTFKSAISKVTMAFEEAQLRIAIADIQPLKIVSDIVKGTPKYAQIAASIREVGIVEPPVVARDPGEPGKYLLLDGHSRVAILRDMGETDVVCLVSTDDEVFRESNGRFWGIIAAEMLVDRDFLGFEGGSILAC
jgi:hypothetical protein